nr:hypothetical protein VDP59_003150 [Xanthomonas campestris pv. campestris]
MALLALAPTSLMAAAPTLPGAGFEVEGYQLQLRPDLSTTALSGVQRIRLRSTSDHLTQLTFSPNALQILSAELNGQPIAVTSTTDGITFALPSALAKGARASARLQDRRRAGPGCCSRGQWLLHQLLRVRLDGLPAGQPRPKSVFRLGSVRACRHRYVEHRRRLAPEGAS